MFIDFSLEGSGVNGLTVSFPQWCKAGLEASKGCLEGSGVIFLTVSCTKLFTVGLEASMVLECPIVLF